MIKQLTASIITFLGLGESINLYDDFTLYVNYNREHDVLECMKSLSYVPYICQFTFLFVLCIVSLSVCVCRTVCLCFSSLACFSVTV